MLALVRNIMTLYNTPPSCVLLRDDATPSVWFEHDAHQELTNVQRLMMLALAWDLKLHHTAPRFVSDTGKCTVTLAKGWRVRTSDPSKPWSSIIDDKGRIRGNLLSDPVNPDKPKRLYVNCRYQLQLGYDTVDGKYQPECPVRWQVYDGGIGANLYETEPFEEIALGSSHEFKARVWLESNFPQFRDPFTYWSR